MLELQIVRHEGRKPLDPTQSIGRWEAGNKSHRIEHLTFQLTQAPFRWRDLKLDTELAVEEIRALVKLGLKHIDPSRARPRSRPAHDLCL